MYIPLLWQHEPLPPAPPPRARALPTPQWRKMLAQARPALAGCLSVAPRARATSNPQSQSQAAMIPGIAGCTFRTCGSPQPHWRVSFHTAEEGGKCCRERTPFAASHSAVA